MAADTDRTAFRVEYAPMSDGVRIAYVREGRGGLPLVLLHGWPGSKRLFWRNIRPLAEAGFEVIVPDARGYGDSDVPGDPRRYADVTLSSYDVHELLSALGIDRCVVAGGDFGSAVAQDAALRFPDMVIRQVIWNGAAPLLNEEYAEAGIPSQFEELAAISDHFPEHGLTADEFAAALDTPEKRIEYVKGFFTGRVWKDGHEPRNLASAGSFDDEAVLFQSEQFAEPERLRASFGYYEALLQPELAAGPSRMEEHNPHTPTMILFGIDDEIVSPNNPRRLEIAIHHRVGPYLIERSGHFLQWERADLFNRAITSFCADLLARPATPAGAPADRQELVRE